MAHHASVHEVTMSPTKAKILIRRNAMLMKENPAIKQRKVKRSHVERLAKDMREGRWQFNGETIKLGTDGRIIDGQHRLAACVLADSSFRTLMVEGVDDDTFRSIDIGIVRTGGDLFHIAGRSNGNQLANACVHLWRWECGDSKAFANWNVTPSKLILDEVYQRHPEIEEYIKKSFPVAAVTSSVGLTAVLWYLFAKRDKDLAELFFTSLATGLNMNADEPVYKLREKLLKEKASRHRLRVEEIADLVTRAWTATRKGEKLQRLIHPRRVDGVKASANGRSPYKLA